MTNELFTRIRHYRVVRPIGSGGMSTVYEAVDERLGRTVALKLLHPHLCSEPVAQERFRREAMAAARLDHPHIVRLFDYLTEEGAHCLVMEFVPGTDLETFIKRHGPLAPDPAFAVMHRVAQALKVAHEAGIMHRDVKPSNILFHRDGRVMLSDFGLAKHSLETSITMDNAVAGTPAFMSPEQISGRKLTFATDLYAWGVTWHYLLTGRIPYDSTDFGGIVAAIQEGRVRVDGPGLALLNSRLRAALERCLLTDPAERFRDGGDLLKTLGPAPSPQVDQELVESFRITESGVSDFATEKGITRTSVSFLGRSRIRRLLIGLVLVLVAVAGVVTYRVRKTSPLPVAVPVVPPAASPAGAPESPALKGPPATRTNRESRKAKVRTPLPPAPDTVAVPVVAAPLPVDTGFLFVFVEPWANVMVDGIEYGRTPLEAPIALPAGRRWLRLTHPFSDPIDDTVLVKAGETGRKRYTVKLRPGYNQ